MSWKILLLTAVVDMLLGLVLRTRIKYSGAKSPKGGKASVQWELLPYDFKGVSDIDKGEVIPPKIKFPRSRKL